MDQNETALRAEIHSLRVELALLAAATIGGVPTSVPAAAREHVRRFARATLECEPATERRGSSWSVSQRLPAA